MVTFASEVPGSTLLVVRTTNSTRVLYWSIIGALGPTLRIMSRHGEDLLSKRATWRVRATRRRFGTAFVVHGRTSTEHPQQLAYRLHQLGMLARSA